MDTAFLRGREHLELGHIAAIAEGPAAIALSRGGAKKTYRHSEPNEDAALFGAASEGLLVAVADGHFGASGSERALELLWAERAVLAAAAVQGDWEPRVLELLAAIDRRLVAEAQEAGRMPAPTTLSLAWVPRAGAGLFHAQVGDSLAFACRGDEVVELSAPESGNGRARFLGEGLDPEQELAPCARIGRLDRDGVDVIVLATDGLSERGIGVDEPARAVGEVIQEARAAGSERAPLEAARALVERALDAHRRHHAGDNMASAVAWL